jgi:hypothetical protein
MMDFSVFNTWNKEGKSYLQQTKDKQASQQKDKCRIAAHYIVISGIAAMERTLSNTSSTILYRTNDSKCIVHAVEQLTLSFKTIFL